MPFIPYHIKVEIQIPQLTHNTGTNKTKTKTQ